MRGGAGKDLGLAAAPTALLGVLVVVMAVVTAVLVWLAWGHLKKSSKTGWALALHVPLVRAILCRTPLHADSTNDQSSQKYHASQRWVNL